MNRKKLYLFLIINFFLGLYINSSVIAQSIPSFKMLLTNGKTLAAKNLTHTKPVVIIYFSPDCEHCQILMNALFTKIDNFKSAEIIMATFRPLKEVASFEKSYQTYKYPNIIVGTEVPVFFFKVYYNLLNTPFTILFDKRGEYIYSYRKETPIDDLALRIKMLK
ncbi:MAG: TlpA family protein disulfide reductase [Chitinophagaceae bacterium]